MPQTKHLYTLGEIKEMLADKYNGIVEIDIYEKSKIMLKDLMGNPYELDDEHFLFEVELSE